MAVETGPVISELETRMSARLFDESVEVFYDGDCPLCKREIGFLQRRDRQGRIRFTDIANPAFRPAEFGMTADDFISEIKGRLPDGTWISGVEVFRRLYTAIGWGPLMTLTRLPVVRQILDVGYRLFAKNRLRLTGRCSAAGCSIPQPENGG